MGNLKKTIRYFKRNGFVNTYYAVKERLFYKDVPFMLANDLKLYDGPLDENIKFSILVPVYETNEKYLREMIESCLSQLYTNFELILADASMSDEPQKIIASYDDNRIKYIRLPENKGISENTNEALKSATGEYCGLLDHDDLLTEDALYEMAIHISSARKDGIKPKFLYSNEDKCNSETTKFYGTHVKQELNLDLLLSNNYICHFSVLETELLKELKLRSEYNGSQDYDLFLRAVGIANSNEVIFVNRVLYHWRCHENSTAFDPAAKDYAYEAGRKAIDDFVKTKFNADLMVKDSHHKGFYEVEWGEKLFEIRPDIGAVGGRVLKGNKVISAIINKDETESLANINRHYSGYMHRADLYQDVYACDIRTVKVRPELEGELKDALKKLEKYKSEGKHTSKEIASYSKYLGYELGKEVEKKGLRFLYDPNIK